MSQLLLPGLIFPEDESIYLIVDTYGDVYAGFPRTVNQYLRLNLPVRLHDVNGFDNDWLSSLGVCGPHELKTTYWHRLEIKTVCVVEQLQCNQEEWEPFFAQFQKP